jgi:hypothetical protein
MRAKAQAERNKCTERKTDKTWEICNKSSEKVLTRKNTQAQNWCVSPNACRGVCDKSQKANISGRKVRIKWINMIYYRKYKAESLKHCSVLS